MADTKQINVTVSGRSISVDVEQCGLKHQDTVVWASTTGDAIRIEFTGESPFDAASLSYAEATTARSPRRDAEMSDYKYDVVLESDPSIRLDPIIIVEDPPTYFPGQKGTP